MTTDKDFKALVRDRMRRTGETYTTARRVLSRRPAPQGSPRERAERDQHRLVARWFDDGRLRAVPARRKVRAAVLLALLDRITPGRDYHEPEINELLRPAHPDVAYLRRELVGFGYLTRRDGIYRVSTTAPVRTPQQRAELPRWEHYRWPQGQSQNPPDASSPALAPTAPDAGS